MGTSKTEVNLRRLLAAAPQQQNQAKLIHYVATLRELLEQLAEERTPEGLPRHTCRPSVNRKDLKKVLTSFSLLNFGLFGDFQGKNKDNSAFEMLVKKTRVSKAVVNDYSEKIEAFASTVAAPVNNTQVTEEPLTRASVLESSSRAEEENHAPSSPQLRRRFVQASNLEDRTHDATGSDTSAPVKLDAMAQAHIHKHRKLQEDLTDEMVGLARQLKESSLTMSQSLENSEKVLDSTEKAVEQSLASTGHANTRAMKIYSESSKTTCLHWLVIFAMTFIFVMVVLLIRVT